MYIITGGAGMIGSALLWELNNRGITDILVVDNLAKTEKWQNLVKRTYVGYMHRDDFLEGMDSGELADKSKYVKGIVHLGACSSTTERDADFLMRNNHDYSQKLCDFALSKGIRYIQASSAATYGDGSAGFEDDVTCLDKLRPLNMYGYSKHLFDRWAVSTGAMKRMASIKFFNVYGPNEYHKGDMRSMVQKSVEQIRASGKIQLFRSHRPDYEDGGQVRDFIYVKDCARILADLLFNPKINGLFNLGSGRARSWNDLAKAVFAAMGRELRIEYVDMPEILQGRYQYFTEAKMGRLEKAMKKIRPWQIMDLEEGVADYVQNYLCAADPYV
jgi:ADP-L-glycero-D-manno-heptose 6-epimerase